MGGGKKNVTMIAVELVLRQGGEVTALFAEWLLGIAGEVVKNRNRQRTGKHFSHKILKEN